MMNTPDPPPALKALLEALDRATDPEARQRAWNALVEYQRQQEVRAQPREDPPRG
jgi:hypothetical protein